MQYCIHVYILVRYTNMTYFSSPQSYSKHSCLPFHRYRVHARCTLFFIAALISNIARWYFVLRSVLIGVSLFHEYNVQYQGNKALPNKPQKSLLHYCQSLILHGCKPRNHFHITSVTERLWRRTGARKRLKPFHALGNWSFQWMGNCNGPLPLSKRGSDQ